VHAHAAPLVPRLPLGLNPLLQPRPLQPRVHTQEIMRTTGLQAQQEGRALSFALTRQRQHSHLGGEATRLLEPPLRPLVAQVDWHEPGRSGQWGLPRCNG